MGQSPDGSTTVALGAGTPLLGGAADIKSDRVEPTRATTAPTKLSEPGDVLLCIRATIGRPVILNDVYALGRGVAVLRPRCVNAEYLRYLLVHLQSRLEAEATGSTFVQISGRAFDNIEAPLPPANEQRRLVAKLDAIFEQTRAIKARLERVPDLLDRLKRSLLTAAFRGHLTTGWRAAHPSSEPASTLLHRIRSAHRQHWEEALRAKGRDPTKANYHEPSDVNAAEVPALPAGWAWARAELAVEPGTVITYGIVLPGKHVADGVPYVRQQDIQDGDVRVSELLRTEPEIAARYDRSSLREGDVLLCIIRHRRVAIVPPGLHGANITQGTVRLRPSSWMRGPFLAAWLESPMAQRWMESRVFGLDMPRINVGDAREVPVPVPPIAEQERIMELLRTAGAKLDGLVASHRNSQKLAEQLERAALTKALRGELVEQDPGDEPASVLLDRLQVSCNERHRAHKRSGLDGRSAVRVRKSPRVKE